MWRFGTDADVAVRDQAVRAGGGSRGVLMLPLYPPDGRLYLPSLYEPGGWEPRSGKRITESYFHTLVMREGSLEVKWQGASTRGSSLWIGESFLLG
jgi:hypothetical protein